MGVHARAPASNLWNVARGPATERGRLNAGDGELAVVKLDVLFLELIEGSRKSFRVDRWPHSSGIADIESAERASILVQNALNCAALNKLSRQSCHCSGHRVRWRSAQRRRFQRHA